MPFIPAVPSALVNGAAVPDTSESVVTVTFRSRYLIKQVGQYTRLSTP